jgi:Animal haem peroxidase
MHRRVLSTILLVLLLPVVGAGSGTAVSFDTRTLDGSNNNLTHPTWGQAGTQYARVAPANYADGIGQMVAGPSPRYISNRIFNDVGQNIFSENNISQWGWAWGQFIDHDIGLRDETSAEDASMPYDKHDPLESFNNDVGTIADARTPAAPGIGVTSPRQQINTISSFIDGSQVYGVTNARLDWLRNGPVDGNPTNNGATLLMPGNYLPHVTARGNASTAPAMDLMGQLVGNPSDAIVAGDVRADENAALTAIQTLFAREHNRIVAQLAGAPLTAEDKFQIARRVVGTEIHYITYNQFLPTLGVELAPYRGYQAGVNPTLGNEFATVGFRAHSMVHGEFEVTVAAGTYTDTQLNSVFPSEGLTVERNADGTVTVVIPLVAAFGNPDLLEQIGEGNFLTSLDEHQYENDEQIDNSLRSVLFEVPKPNGNSPPACATPVILPSCFTDVSDLGADDVVRGRDHGMPSYNDLRRAYGLPPARSFTDITGESTDQFPTNDPKVDPTDPIDDPNILGFVQLRDAAGNVIPLGSPAAQEDAVVGVRRTTLAARLRAIYGNVNKVDAFVGMVSEKHVPGTEFGPLQLAIWKKQFAAVRDGDRFFYLNDPALQTIQQTFRITYQHTLAELVKLGTGVTVPSNVLRPASDRSHRLPRARSAQHPIEDTAGGAPTRSEPRLPGSAATTLGQNCRVPSASDQTVGAGPHWSGTGRGNGSAATLGSDVLLVASLAGRIERCAADIRTRNTRPTGRLRNRLDHLTSPLLLARPGDICLRDHSDELVLTDDDWKTPHLGTSHHLERIVQVVVGRQRVHLL